MIKVGVVRCHMITISTDVPLQLQFRSYMLYPILQILLQSLVQKSHDLLQEEMYLCVYNMAAVDFTIYHQQFLPKFLGSMQGLAEHQHSQLAKNYKTVEASKVPIDYHVR